MLQQVLSEGEQQHIAQFDETAQQLGQAQLQAMRPQAHGGQGQTTLTQFSCGQVTGKLWKTIETVQIDKEE